MRDIVVVGAGGFGRESLDVIDAVNAAEAEPVWRVVGVVDDAPAAVQLQRLGARGLRHLGTVAEVLRTTAASAYVVGIGSPALRARISADFDRAGWTPAILIHPRATLGSEVSLGAGVVICAGVQLSTNTRLGQQVHLNPGAIVGHDTELEDFVSVNPGAVISGEVVVERGSLVGAGAVVLQGLRIGAGVTIGAAACVTRSVEPDSTMVGIPARKQTSRANAISTDISRAPSRSGPSISSRLESSA